MAKKPSTNAAAHAAAIDTTDDTEGRVTVMGHIDDETYGDDKNDHDTTDDTDTTDSRDTQGHTDGGADVESAEDRADREAEAMPHAHTPIGVERAKRVKRAPVTMEQITNYQAALVDLAACANKVERDELDVVAARKVLAGMIDALNTTKVQYRHAAEQVAECAKLVTMPRRTTKADA